MPGAGRLRRRRAALVGQALPRRLHVLWLARPAASGVVGLRRSAPAHRSACQSACQELALRLARTEARHDRLLAQRHASRHGAQRPPSPDVLHQRHLLCRRAARGGGAQVRGSAPLPPDGRAAAPRRRPAALPFLRQRQGGGGRSRSCSRAGCATKCRRRASPASGCRSASITAGKRNADEQQGDGGALAGIGDAAGGGMSAGSATRRWMGGVLRRLYDRLPARAVAYRRG